MRDVTDAAPCDVADCADAAALEKSSPIALPPTHADSVDPSFAEGREKYPSSESTALSSAFSIALDGGEFTRVSGFSAGAYV